MTAASSFPFAKSQNRVGKPLFSKENIPLGLAGMPGLFQPRMDLCCLACSVKVILKNAQKIVDSKSLLNKFTFYRNLAFKDGSCAILNSVKLL